MNKYIYKLQEMSNVRKLKCVFFWITFFQKNFFSKKFDSKIKKKKILKGRFIYQNERNFYN